jgi:hypothetical protein
MAKSLLALALGLIGGGTCNRGPLAFLSGGLRSAGNAHANGLSQAGKGPHLPRGAAYTVGARRPLSENYRSNSYTVVNRANGC